MHVIDGIVQILAPLAAALGVTSTRLCMDARVSDFSLGPDAPPSTSADRFGAAYPHVPPASHAFYARVCDESARAAVTYRAHGIRSTAAFVGLSTMGALMTRDHVRAALRGAIEAAAASVASIQPNDGAALESIDGQSAFALSSSPPSLWIEFMTHPGHCQLDSGDVFGDDFSRSADRQMELDFLRGAEFRELLASFGSDNGGDDLISLRSWREFNEQFQHQPPPPSLVLPPLARPPAPIRILFLSPLTVATGNRTTAMRLCRGLERCGHAVTMVDSTRLQSDREAAAACGNGTLGSDGDDEEDGIAARHACRAVDEMCASGRFDIVFALHAYRSARFLLKSCSSSSSNGSCSLSAAPLPIVIVLGGTDTVLHRQAPAKVPVAHLALRRASRIVAFNAEMRQLISEWCDAAVVAKTDIVAPSFALATEDEDADGAEVDNGGADGDDEVFKPIKVAFSLRHWLECVAPHAPLPDEALASASTRRPPRMRVLLLIAGLRPVKDVAYLFDAVREWHRRDPRIRMVCLCRSVPAAFLDLFSNHDEFAPFLLSGGDWTRARR